MIEHRIDSLAMYYSLDQAEILRKRAIAATTFNSMNYLGRQDYMPLLTENLVTMMYESLSKEQKEHYINTLSKEENMDWLA